MGLYMKTEEDIRKELWRLKHWIELFEDCRGNDEEKRIRGRNQLIKELGGWKSVTPKLWRREIQNLKWVLEEE